MKRFGHWDTERRNLREEEFHNIRDTVSNGLRKWHAKPQGLVISLRHVHTFSYIHVTVTPGQCLLGQVSLSV